MPSNVSQGARNMFANCGGRNVQLGAAGTHIHHQAQVSHVVSLRLHQLQQDVAATDKTRRDEVRLNKQTRRSVGGGAAHCLFFSMLARRSSSSSMGDEEESRELSDGLKEGELLSPCSTDSVLGRSSRA